MKEEKLKKLISKKCLEDRDPHLWEITSSAPVQIEGIRIFQSSHDPEMDPMPYMQWVLVDDSKLYDGDKFIEVLKEKKIFPKSEEEALKLSRLIVFARGDPLFDAKHGGKDPVVNKKEDYYEIVLTVLKKPMRVIKVELTIKLGENVYEVNEKEENILEPKLDITEEIRKASLCGEDRQMEIQEIDVPYRISGVKFFRSAFQFHIDPVPYDLWIFVDEKLRKGYEIKEVLKEKKVVPKSKEDAINIAKLIILMEHGNAKIYPDFPKKSGAKKPSATEKDGIYKVILYTSSFPYTFIFKITIRLGPGTYEVEGERSTKN